MADSEGDDYTDYLRSVHPAGANDDGDPVTRLLFRTERTIITAIDLHAAIEARKARLALVLETAFWLDEALPNYWDSLTEPIPY